MVFAIAAVMAAKKTAKRAVKKPATQKAATKGAGRKRVAKKSVAKESVARKKSAPPVKRAKTLAEYNAKRDFTRTSEPPGTVPRVTGKALRFVIQKHAASHLHFDFRLEIDGAMKSWAVPKGPSLDPSVKRLAMEVEDHPISYNTFEGTIPQGEYGGGTVMLWDHGTYDAQDGGGAASLREGYRRGDLKITLSGTHLHGSWVLVRMKRPGRPQWLLIKHDDDHADPSRDVVAEVTKSVASGKTMDQLAARGRVWHATR